jgi:hypothetical protein
MFSGVFPENIPVETSVEERAGAISVQN